LVFGTVLDEADGGEQQDGDEACGDAEFEDGGIGRVQGEEDGGEDRAADAECDGCLDEVFEFDGDDDED